VLAAVMQKGCALLYASNELRNDREIVLAAVMQNYKALRHISQIFQNNVSFILKMAQIHSGIDITPHIQHFMVFNNPEFIRKAIYLPNIKSIKIDKCKIVLPYLPPAILDLLCELI